jgi:hypothetical protein
MVRTRCSVGSLEAHLGGRRSATVAQNIVLKAQGRAAKSRWNSTATPSSCPIRQVFDLLPVFIDSIRLLPHAIWFSIILFHVWVIVNLEDYVWFEDWWMVASWCDE